MRNLPYDYARCSPNDAGCTRKQFCARFTSKGKQGLFQTCMDGSSVSEGKGCDMFIHNLKKDAE